MSDDKIKPDLVYYVINNNPDTQIYTVAQVDDFYYQVVVENIYSSKLGKDTEKLGFQVFEKKYTDASGETVNFRVGQTTVFFDEKLSKINGGLSWMAPNLEITNTGSQSPGTQIIYKLLPGTGDFLNAEGYLVLSSFTTYKLFEIYFTKL